MTAPTFESVFRPGLFAGQVHIVTGAGSGIGRCIAHELSHLGATVVLMGRKVEKLEAVQQELEGESSLYALDIRDEAEVKAAVGQVLEQHGRLDGVVNNAGGQFPAPLSQISKNGFEAVVKTNLVGGFLMAREAFTQYMESHGGAVVNIVADMWMGMPGMGHSGAARAGMINFTETAACEWGPAHVRVNAVAPGWIASSGLDQYPDWMKDALRGLKDHVPLGRHGTEAEVSAAVVFLLSPAARFISGATLRVDGAAPNAKRHWELPARKPSPAYDGFLLGGTPRVLKGE